MKKKILMIEDEAAISSYVGLFLNQEGFEFDHAKNIAEGLTLAKQNTYDLVLLDLMLPDGTGDELLPQLRAQSPKTPVLIMTGVAADDPRLIRCMKNGAVGFVPKSSRAEDLLKGIRRALHE